MKVYDCFLFFNELDLLEIRLNELSEVVDKFVIVESTETHAKKKKKLFFEENKQKFSKFLHKIVHVIVKDTPDFNPRPGRMGTFHSRHDVEWFQRNCIERGLSDAQKDDIIIVSDVDEIIRKSSIEKIKDHFSSKKDFISLNHRLFYYYLNGLCVQNGKETPWWGATACKCENFPGAENLRRTKGNNSYKIIDGGWHFSYLGGPEMIALKIESISHAEWDNDFIKNSERIQKCIDSGKDLFERKDKPNQVYVRIDENFPEFIIRNQKRFSHLIKSI